MASRRRRTLAVKRGPPRAPVFFRPKVLGGSSVGRSPWRSSVVETLLRPVPPGYIGHVARASTEATVRDLRARRARIAPTPISLGRLRQAEPVRLYGRLLPLGKPALFSRSTPCTRRQERREVLFSKRVAGGSVSGFRRPRFSVDSQYSCVR